MVRNSLEFEKHYMVDGSGNGDHNSISLFWMWFMSVTDGRSAQLYFKINQFDLN